MAENDRPSEPGWPSDRPSDPWARPAGQQGGFERPQTGYSGYGQHQPGYQQQPYTGYEQPTAGYEQPTAGYEQPGQQQGYPHPGYGQPSGFGAPGGYGGPGGYNPGVGMPPGAQQYPTAGYPYPYAPQPYTKPKRSPIVIGALALLFLAIPVAAGIGIGEAMQHSNAANSNPSASSGGNGISGGSGTGGSSSTPNSASIAAAVDPGIVDINTTLGYQQQEAAGTGIVLTANGEILTNNHVINGATSISVTDIGNGKTYSANVVGYDRTDDIAVLQLVNASGLTTVSLGDSGSVKIGDSVVALGNAGGQGGTPAVAPGQVTALNRSITASDESDNTSEQLSGLIEVNADVQPGDSGGPLVNSAGKVIGIDTAASTSNGNFQMQGQANGAGFAIPINKATSIANQIKAGTASQTVHIGKTAFLGVESRSASGSAGAGGTGGTGSTGSGVVISGVVQGSPAAQAGLGQGDTITSFNGQNVDSENTLTTLIGAKHPGDQATIGWTDASGAAHTSTVSLANGPAA